MLQEKVWGKAVRFAVIGHRPDGLGSVAFLDASAALKEVEELRKGAFSEIRINLSHAPIAVSEIELRRLAKSAAATAT